MIIAANLLVIAGQLHRGKERAVKWICAMTGALAMAVPAQAAVSDCPVPPAAIKVAFPSGLPPALRKALPDDIALPGEPFDTTDVYVMGHKHSRYTFVWNIGSRWIVAMEQGGIALRAAIFIYDLGKDGKTAALIDKRITFPESVCAAATKLACRVPRNAAPAILQFLGCLPRPAGPRRQNTLPQRGAALRARWEFHGQSPI